MYGNRILRALGKAKAEDLEHIEQKFQVKIPAQSVLDTPGFFTMLAEIYKEGYHLAMQAVSVRQVF